MFQMTPSRHRCGVHTQLISLDRFFSIRPTSHRSFDPFGPSKYPSKWRFKTCVTNVVISVGVGQGVLSRQEDTEDTEWAVLLEDLVSRHLESGWPEWSDRDEWCRILRNSVCFSSTYAAHGSQLLPPKYTELRRVRFLILNEISNESSDFMNLSKNWADYRGITEFFCIWMSCIFSV